MIELIVNGFTTQFVVGGRTVLITDTADLAREVGQAMLHCRHKDGQGKAVHLALEAQVPLRA